MAVIARSAPYFDLPTVDRPVDRRTLPLAIAVTTISVIVPVYNGGTAFAICLASLARYLPLAEIVAEVIVVVDGQDDESVQIAQSLRSPEFSLTIVTLPQNSGPAHARNVGAAMATGELLFFVDADVEVLPETLPSLLRVFAQNPQLAAMIGSYDDAPGSRNFLSQYKNLLHHYTHQMARSEASTFWGACGGIRREVFWAMGGFDATYRAPCIEDIELGYRLKRSGHRIRLCRDVQVKHLKCWGTRSLLKADFFYRAIPWTELIWRDRSFVSDLNLDASSRLSVASVYGMLLALLSTIMWGQALLLVVLCGLVLLTLNAPVYRFFHHKRGLWFALRAIPWHWLYYGYSGLAFVIGTSRYWWTRPRS
jgi:GT2 family glycosyltransferase